MPNILFLNLSYIAHTMQVPNPELMGEDQGGVKWYLPIPLNHFTPQCADNRNFF